MLSAEILCAFYGALPQTPPPFVKGGPKLLKQGECEQPTHPFAASATLSPYNQKPPPFPLMQNITETAVVFDCLTRRSSIASGGGGYVNTNAKPTCLELCTIKKSMICAKCRYILLCLTKQSWCVKI